jgi:hypothetical protein
MVLILLLSFIKASFIPYNFPETKKEGNIFVSKLKYPLEEEEEEKEDEEEIEEEEEREEKEDKEEEEETREEKEE